MTGYGRFAGLRKLFGHRIVRGEILPPDARVKPDEFPEEEFPVHCPDCDYLLRGLPEERCPECGRDFERGRLLVEQYVLAERWRPQRRMRSRTRWIEAIGWLLCFGYPALSGLAWYRTNPTAPPSPIVTTLMGTWWVAVFVGLSLVLGANIVSAYSWNTGRRKRKRVYEAIDRASTSFEAARRYQWVVTGLGVAGALVVTFLACWEMRDIWPEYRSIRRFFAEDPRRFLYVIGIALAIGMGLFVGNAAWKRWGPRDGDDDT